jgi:hypothetical protein
MATDYMRVANTGVLVIAYPLESKQASGSTKPNSLEPTIMVPTDQMFNAIQPFYKRHDLLGRTKGEVS